MILWQRILKDKRPSKGVILSMGLGVCLAGCAHHEHRSFYSTVSSQPYEVNTVAPQWGMEIVNQVDHLHRQQETVDYIRRKAQKEKARQRQVEAHYQMQARQREMARQLEDNKRRLYQQIDGARQTQRLQLQDIEKRRQRAAEEARQRQIESDYQLARKLQDEENRLYLKDQEEKKRRQRSAEEARQRQIESDYQLARKLQDEENKAAGLA